MKTKRFAQLLAVLSITFGCGYAMAVNEVEPNNTVDTAQPISSPWGNIQVNAIMGASGDTQHNDLDFYQFTARAGDVLTIDIDNGYTATAPLNTIVAIFGPAPDYMLLRMADLATTDPGSSSIFDARIVDFVVPRDGNYTVGVSTVPRYFSHGGITFSGLLLGSTDETIVKDYTLEISGVNTNKTKKINIEVKPGSTELSPLNPLSKGKIPVAILGSLYFSVMTIDTESLTFGASGKEKSLHKCAKSTEDVNGDGFNDLVCHFETRKTGFSSDSLEGTLMGQTESNEPFEGRSLLKIIPRLHK